MYQKPAGMLLATILYMVESKLEKEAFWYASKMPSPRNGLLQDENGVRDQLVKILQVSKYVLFYSMSVALLSVHLSTIQEMATEL
ncbi:hypothetical protein SAY86_013017 [Trapa natans]|uniref:Uncharacterized protein n=1 Tax=Trapa natans TaxID=22666 RepID=A0AAN7MDS9_TRANT|nr:hypothetical protein SAY86_013017 [Trapa natans]